MGYGISTSCIIGTDETAAGWIVWCVSKIDTDEPVFTKSEPVPLDRVDNKVRELLSGHESRAQATINSWTASVRENAH